MSDILRHFSDESAQIAFVNIAPLARMARQELPERPETADIATMLDTLGRTGAGLGFAVARDEGVLTIRFAAGKDVTENVSTLAWKSLAASVGQAREQSKRIVSRSNLKGIITGCMIYSNDHKGAWPATLGELLQAGHVAPSVFRSPFDESEEPITAANVDRVSSYLYRAGTKSAADEVVACEREMRNGGCNFAFADGHVSWIDGPQAEELLAMMRSAATN
jgi:prepilin-type processing-associated H-X9-DG protein